MSQGDRNTSYGIALAVWALACVIIAASLGVVWLIHQLIGGLT